jgi:hypothetical protein
MEGDGPLFDSHVGLAGQVDKMVASGVESLRVTFSWSGAQPYATWMHVPQADAGLFQNGAGDVPTKFGFTDEMVALAAERHLQLLPVVMYAPSWDAAGDPPGTIAVAPRTDGPYADYLSTLIARYGPNGSFWSANPGIPKVPIRRWQIWNEPNLGFYWTPRPSAKTYVDLVRAARTVIKKADPGAQVVLAGMPDFAWKYLSQVYKVPGAARSFDLVAVHPYTLRPSGVITFLQNVRQVMDQNGDRQKPILATEVSWPSALGKTEQLFGIETTEAGQASNIAALLPMLASRRAALKLEGFYYYTWVTHEYRNAPSFNFAGLFKFQGNRLQQKPAYDAFRRAALALDACRVKGSVATVCARR